VPIKEPIYVIYENDLLGMEFMGRRALMHLLLYHHRIVSLHLL
jgi:hypothetical protein